MWESFRPVFFSTPVVTSWERPGAGLCCTPARPPISLAPWLGDVNHLHLFPVPGGGSTGTRPCLQPSSGSSVVLQSFGLLVLTPSSGFPSCAAATEHRWMAVGGSPGIQLAAGRELSGRRDAAPPPALQIMALSVGTKRWEEDYP